MARTATDADIVTGEAAAEEILQAQPVATGANVIVLAEDATLLELVKHALDGRQRVWRADDGLHAADLLVAAQSGILLLDAALTLHETPDFVDKLHAQFPDVPIVVTGRRDDEAELGQRISSGIVFRFLHKPVSAERIRNFMDAAARRAGDAPPSAKARAANGSGAAAGPRLALRLPRVRLDPARRRQLLRAGGLLAALVLAAWAVAALVQARPWKNLSLPASPPAAPAAAPVVAAPVPSPGQRETVRLLSAAGIALSQGRLAEPPGQNAIELYRAVLARDPGNAEARQGLAQTAAGLLARVDEALRAGDAATAAGALDAARSADPANPQLAYYSAQLEQAREPKTTPAATMATAGTGMQAADRAQAEQVARFLSQADQRMKQGRLAGGPDTAESYILQAKALSPDGTAVQQALNALSGRMLLAASEAISRGDASAADGWLDQADSLGVDPQGTARLRAQVASIQVATVQEDRSRLLALANQRIAQGQLVDPPGDSARHYVDLLRASDPSYQGLADTEALLASRLVDQARQATREKRFADATKLLDVAAAAGASAADVKAARGELGTGMAIAAAAKQVLPENALTRKAHPSPVYPLHARERGIEGWVTVRFTVAADGTTRDIEVTGAQPPGVFDQAVADAISAWRYAPHIVAGKPVDQRVEARLRFELSGN